jgi:hypothetical protein
MLGVFDQAKASVKLSYACRPAALVVTSQARMCDAARMYAQIIGIVCPELVD